MDQIDTVFQGLGLAFWLNIAGAVVGCSSAAIFAVRIWRGKEEANIATWLVVFLLDWGGLYLAYTTGNEKPYLQIGWCAAATCILAAVAKTHGVLAWHSSGVTKEWRGYLLSLRLRLCRELRRPSHEMVTVAICLLAIAIWIASGIAWLALAAYTAAMFVSAWPQARDYLKRPHVARKSSWVWLVSVISLELVVGSQAIDGTIDVPHTLVYAALLMLNIVMSAICLRGQVEQPI